GLRQHLAVEAERARLVGQDRSADLLAEHSQPVLIGLPERLDLDFGAADLGERRLAETAENVANAPNAEAYGNQAEQDAHDRPAEPVGRGFVNTAKHGQTPSGERLDGQTAVWRTLIGSANRCASVKLKGRPWPIWGGARWSRATGR